jgi:hypothetical protein
MVGARRDPVAGLETNRVRAGGSAIGIRWLYAVLLVAIAIAAIAGVVSTAALGHTQAAVAIAIIALAFFSRVGC